MIYNLGLVPIVSEVLQANAAKRSSASEIIHSCRMWCYSVSVLGIYSGEGSSDYVSKTNGADARWKVVYVAHSEPEASIVAGRLESMGIETFVHRETTGNAAYGVYWIRLATCPFWCIQTTMIRR